MCFIQIWKQTVTLPYAILTDWYLSPSWRIFTERYALILYVKVTVSVFTGLKVTQECGINEFNYCSVFVEGSKKIWQF